MTTNLQNINEALFNDIFMRQQDEFSCGPASLATVAKLYQVKNTDYEKLRELLNPSPQTGSCNFRMADISRNLLPFASVGEDCYAGGIAVANITKDEGHYVVFLYREKDDVIYYDPYDHKIVTTPLTGLNWTSESGHLKRWAINYNPLPGNSFEIWQKFQIFTP